MLLIGAECDARWGELAKKLAMERYEALPKTKEVRLEQSRAKVALRFRATPQKRAELKDIAEDIRQILGHEGHVVIAIKRPYGAKPGIIADVIAHMREKYDVTLSASQVAESWKRYNKFKKTLEFKSV